MITWRTFLSSSSPVTTATRAGWDFGGLRCSSWYAIAASASDLWGLSWLGELGPEASAQECAKSASVLSSSSKLKRPHFQHHRHELRANKQLTYYSYLFSFLESRATDRQHWTHRPKSWSVKLSRVLKSEKHFPNCWISLGPLVEVQNPFFSTPYYMYFTFDHCIGVNRQRSETGLL